MRKAFLMSVSVAVLVVVSGCSAIGRYTRPEDGGKRVTVGLISIDSVSEGCPMIPLYSSFEKDK